MLSKELNTKITLNDFLMGILQQTCKTYHDKHNLEKVDDIVVQHQYHFKTSKI